MNILIRHLWQNNRDEIVSKSLFNCHCEGLHSIMLSESPGKTIRLYIADIGNKMDKNFGIYKYENGYQLPPKDMTIAFHPHHCNLTLHCIKGNFFNWSIEKSDTGYLLGRNLYRSKIKDGELKFEFSGKTRVKTKEIMWVSEGRSISLPANEIHTIACHSHYISSWLVYEGIEDKNYISECYSLQDLNNADYSHLYIKATEKQIEDLLKKCELI